MIDRNDDAVCVYKSRNSKEGEEVDDETLVEELRRRNQNALNILVERYGGLITAIVRRHLSQWEADQEECINDILFAIWNHISQYDETKSSFKNWIGAVSKYRCIDYKRRYYRQLCEQPIDEQFPTDGGADKELLAREMSEETESLLAYLSETDRVLFWDCYVEGKDMQTLSAEHQMKPSVIYNRLSRGKKRIRTSCFKKE